MRAAYDPIHCSTSGNTDHDCESAARTPRSIVGHIVKIWAIVPDESLPDDRAYLIGFLKACFEKVMVTRALRTALSCEAPDEKPDVVLNLVSARSLDLLKDIDEKAAEWNVPVSPPSHGSFRTEDKRTYLEDFPDVSPPTRIIGSLAELEAVRTEFGGDVVVKEPFGYRGTGVERIAGTEHYGLAENLLKNGYCNTGQLVVQPYYSGFSTGDKRILLQRRPDDSFEIAAFFTRVPPPGGWKSNLRGGGRSVETKLSDAERAFVTELAPRGGIDNISFDIGEHEGRLWYIEHNQGYGGIVDYDLDFDTCNVKLTAEFLRHIAKHGRTYPPEDIGKALATRSNIATSVDRFKK